jgi:hypothetical protein
MVLRRATSLRGALERVGPENRAFFGPTTSATTGQTKYLIRKIEERATKFLLYLNTVTFVTYSMETANSYCIQHSSEWALEKLVVIYEHVLCTEQVYLG